MALEAGMFELPIIPFYLSFGLAEFEVDDTHVGVNSDRNG